MTASVITWIIMIINTALQVWEYKRGKVSALPAQCQEKGYRGSNLKAPVSFFIEQVTAINITVLRVSLRADAKTDL